MVRWASLCVGRSPLLLLLLLSCSLLSTSVLEAFLYPHAALRPAQRSLGARDPTDDQPWAETNLVLADSLYSLPVQSGTRGARPRSLAVDRRAAADELLDALLGSSEGASEGAFAAPGKRQPGGFSPMRGKKASLAALVDLGEKEGWAARRQANLGGLGSVWVLKPAEDLAGEEEGGRWGAEGRIHNGFRLTRGK